MHNENIEAQGIRYKDTKMKHKKHYAKFKMINVCRLWWSNFECFLKPLQLHKRVRQHSFIDDD